MNDNHHITADIPLGLIIWLAILILPLSAISANLLHNFKLLQSDGKWCQILTTEGGSQVLYGTDCYGARPGLVRRFQE